MTAEEIKALQDSKAAADAEVARLKAEIEKNKPPPKDDDKDKDKDKDLHDKTVRDRETAAEAARKQSVTEKAIQFNLSIETVLKDNKEILPKNISDILATAKKANYESKIDEANSIRAAIVQEFFSLEENVARLTASQKATLDQFLKLAKNAKEERAESVFENIFEPQLEMVRQIKKAEELERSKHGQSNQTDFEKSYKERLIKHSKKALLGQKETA